MKSSFASGMIRASIVVFLLVASGAWCARADTADLYGGWAGTWSPNFKFTGNRVPSGSPPYAPTAVQFFVHDLISDHGYVTVSGALGGDITAVSLDGTTVRMTVFYPGEGDPTGYGDLVGVRNGDTITGTFNERAPAGRGFEHWEGPITLTRLPVPPAALLGRWSGEVVEQRSSARYPVTMNLNALAVAQFAGSIEYPTLNCGGTLTFLRGSGGEFVFREHIRETNRCVDGGTIVTSLTADDVLKWDWYSPSSNTLSASAGLSKVPFEADRDCPCAPPQGAVPEEELLASISGLTENLLNATDAIPRCGELRAAYFDAFARGDPDAALDFYNREHASIMGAVQDLGSALRHSSSIYGELIPVQAGGVYGAIKAVVEAFIGFYRHASGVRGSRAAVDGVSSGSPVPDAVVAINGARGKKFVRPLHQITELRAELTAEVGESLLGVLPVGEQFAEKVVLADGQQGSALITVDSLSPDGTRASMTVRAFTRVPELPCPGDCDGTRIVTISELVMMVNVALGNSPLSACTAGDANGDGQVRINELLQAVNGALTGCPIAL